MNLSQDCFITDNLNNFIERHLKDCKDEHAAEHIMKAVKNLAGDMDEFPEDDWHGIKLADGTELDANFYTFDHDRDGIDELEIIALYIVKDGDTDLGSGMDIYRKKLNIVQPAHEQPGKTFKVKCWTKKCIVVDIEAETEQEAIDNAKTASALGEFENEDFTDDGYGFECLGEVKDFEIEVKMTVSAKFRQKGTDPVDAIETVKSEIANGEFDIALLTDYDKGSAQVVYLGNPDEKNNQTKEA